MQPEAVRLGDLDRLILSDPDSGEYLLHRDLFRDERIFELEMKYLFERNWVYLAHESQVPNPHDYLSSWIGRTPVIVWRNGAGKLAAFINSCPHKGSRLCHLQAGNAKQLVCGYHGWTFDSSGQNILVKDEAQGSYAEPFKRLDHGLIEVKSDICQGFIFASLSTEVPSLDEHLSEIRPLIDMVAKQSEAGMEVLPGHSAYTYDANWKMQIENCADIYHLTSAHPSFMNLVARRRAGESKNKQVVSADIAAIAKSKSGSFLFDRGHTLVWTENPSEASRPLYESKPDLVRRHGQVVADWMFYTRNLTIYPSVQFADNAALQIRQIRPLAPNKTEMRIYCLAPKAESDRAREIRIRQYEDFYNTTGLATPDDTCCYDDCQAGIAAPTMRWQQGYCRGINAGVDGPDEFAARIGIKPLRSVCGEFGVQDETVFHANYRFWMRQVRSGLQRDGVA